MESVRYLCRERRTGTFERSFEIDDIDKDAVTVSFENGVLHIVLPKVQGNEDKMVYDIK